MKKIMNEIDVKTIRLDDCNLNNFITCKKCTGSIELLKRIENERMENDLSEKWVWISIQNSRNLTNDGRYSYTKGYDAIKNYLDQNFDVREFDTLIEVSKFYNL